MNRRHLLSLLALGFAAAAGLLLRIQRAAEITRGNELIHAAERGDARKVEKLLDDGVSPDSRLDGLSYNESAIWAALVHRHTEVLRLLMTRGARAGAEELDDAVAADDLPDARLLLSEALAAGRSRSVIGPRSHLARVTLCEAVNSASAVALLLDAGVDPNGACDPSPFGPSRDVPGAPLDVASHWDDTATMRLLLQHGATPDGTALLFACATSTAATRLLLDRGLWASGAYPVAPSSSELDTPMHYAILYGSPGSAIRATVALLLQRGANPDQRCPNGKYGGETPLIRAVLNRKPALVRLLLAHGADPNLAVPRRADVVGRSLSTGPEVPPGPESQAGSGDVALHVAALKGYASIARLLLVHGGNPNVKDAYGRTPLELARKESRGNVVKLMEESRGAM